MARALSNRRKRVRRRKDEILQYELRVSGWDHYYNFRVCDPKSHFDPGPYSELSTLTFKGTMKEPAAYAGQRGELTLSAQAALMTRNAETLPTSIGGLSAHAETFFAYIFLPAERLAELTSLAISGRVQVATIAGTKLRYRSGRAHSVSISTDLEEEEDEESVGK